MSDKFTGFKADLRYPVEDRENSGDKRSQWSSLSMIELNALDTYQFVKAMISRPAQNILEIGCGNGYLSLELARDGHEVTGLDRSSDIIKVAEGTRAASPDTSGFGKLTYYCADFNEWQSAAANFDLVIINRTLHHLTGLQPTLEKVKYLLTNDGRIICQDYAYDRLNEQTASWVYSMQRMLYLSKLADEGPTTTDDDEQSIEALRNAWFKRSEDHHLNRFEEMLPTLRTMFHEQIFSWVPYLFVYIGNRIRYATAEQERAFLTFLKNMEEYLTERGYMQAVGFRYVGII